MMAGALHPNCGHVGRIAGGAPLYVAWREDCMDEPERDGTDDGDAFGERDDLDSLDELGDAREGGDTVEAGEPTRAPASARTRAEPEAAALAALLGRVGGGDEDAFAELYDATVGHVHGMALRILRETRSAEEVTEDAFFQVWREARRFDPARGRPLAWILTIARSRALDHLRRRDPAQSHPDPDSLLDAEPAAAGGPQDLLAASRDSGHVHQALAALDPVPRQMIALAFFRGYTHEEIAVHADLPIGTVKSHIRRALAALRGMLAAGTERSSIAS